MTDWTVSLEQASGSAVYIYNQKANLRELERVNLAGAQLVFNGNHRLRDLSRVDFGGATVFINGQAMVRH